MKLEPLFIVMFALISIIGLIYFIFIRYYSFSKVLDIEGNPLPEPQPVLTTLGIRLHPIIPNSLLTWFTTNVCRNRGESKDPQARIQFARDYGVRWREARLCGDIESLEECVGRFGTLNDFFTRHIHPELTQVVPENMAANILVSPAECRMHVPMGDNFDIKGTKHSVTSLMGPASFWLPTVASIAIFRLAPQDYHRVHAPAEGVVMHVEDIPGTFQSVSGTHSQVLVENARRVMCIQTHVGPMALIKVGATCVGSIRTSVTAGDHIQKGQDLGDFAFGGSCVVLVSQAQIQWHPRILHHSAAGHETFVRAGTGIGSFLKPN